MNFLLIFICFLLCSADICAEKSFSLRVPALGVILDYWFNLSHDQSKQLYQACVAKDLPTFKSLLDDGALLKYRNKDGQTVLHEIAKGGRFDFFYELKKRGLLYCANRNNPFIFGKERGYIDVECRDNDGKTPMHICAQHSDRYTAEDLLLFGADPVAQDNRGNIPLFYALQKNSEAIIDLLYYAVDKTTWHTLCTTYKNNNNDKNMAIHFAASGNAQEMIKKILAMDASLVNKQNAFGNTPLHIAIHEGHQDLVCLLVDKNADLTLRTYNADGNTPLHSAVVKKNKDMVVAIVKKNPTVLSIENGKHQSAFELASLAKWDEGITFFMSETDVKDSNYIFGALKSDNYQLTETLIKNGAPVAIKDTDGNTPLAVACAKLDYKHASLFLEYALPTLGMCNKDDEYPLHLLLRALKNQKDILPKDIKMLKLMLRADAPLVDSNNNPLRTKAGASVLDLAADLSVEVVNTIIKRCPNKKAVSLLINSAHPATGYSPFLKACKRGNVEHVKLLTSGDKAELEQRLSNNNDLYDGYTPLLLAAAGGHADAYIYLESLGCKVTAQGTNGKTVLFYLIEKAEQLDPQGAKCKNILAQHPDLALLKTVYGNTLLHQAVYFNNNSVALYLIATFPQLINEQNKWGETPVNKAISKSRYDLVEQMKQAPGFECIVNGSSYLQQAIEQDNENAMNAFLKDASLAILNRIDEHSGYTPLTCTIDKGNKRFLVPLLNAGAAVDVPDRFGNTPLHKIALSEDERIIDLLLSRLAGGDSVFSLKNNKGKTPILNALRNKKAFEPIIKKMSNSQRMAFFNTTSCDGKLFIQYAIENNYQEFLRTGLQYGLDPNQPYADGTFPLHHAARLGRDTLVKLITSSATTDNPVSINVLDNQGRNGLMIAAFHGYASLFDYFLSKKSSTTTVSHDGKTVLHDAAVGGSQAIMEKALAFSYDINVQDQYGNTPLHCAVEKGNLTATRLLLLNKANIEVKNKAGKDVFAIARAQEKQQFFSWDKAEYNSILRYLENEKFDLDKERRDLNQLFLDVHGLCQENMNLFTIVRPYYQSQVYTPASGIHYAVNIAVLTSDQVKKETKVLEEQKKHEEAQKQHLLNLYGQVYQTYAGQNDISYSPFGGIYMPVPSAPPVDDDETAENTDEPNGQQEAGFGNFQPAAQAEHPAQKYNGHVPLGTPMYPKV